MYLNKLSKCSLFSLSYVLYTRNIVTRQIYIDPLIFFSSSFSNEYFEIIVAIIDSNIILTFTLTIRLLLSNACARHSIVRKGMHDSKNIHFEMCTPIFIECGGKRVESARLLKVSRILPSRKGATRKRRKKHESLKNWDNKEPLSLFPFHDFYNYYLFKLSVFPSSFTD